MDSKLICPLCGKFVVRTEQDALICPEAHGKVLGTMNGIDYAVAQRQYRLEQWLDPMPCALQEKEGNAFTVSDRKGLFKRAPVLPDGERQCCRMASATGGPLSGPN